MAYFTYALLQMPTGIDPVAAVREPGWLKLVSPAWHDATWGASRSMWSTASMLDAAGIADASFSFEPVTLSFDAAGKLVRSPAGGNSPTRILRAPDRKQYTDAMLGHLIRLLGGSG